MNVIERIKSKYADLTKTQKKIADYIIDYPEVMCFQSMKEVSESVTVTEVTLINFSKKLEFEGFVSLRNAVREFVQTEVSPNEKIGTYLEDIGEISETTAKFMKSHMKNVEHSLRTISQESLADSVQMIKNARKVYLVGVGISGVVSELFHKRLKLLGVESEIFEITSYNIMSQKTLKIDENDLFIVTSFPKYSKLAALVINYLGQKGVKMISITNDRKSPLAKYSEIIFECENQSMVFFNSMVTPIMVAELILLMLASEVKFKFKDNLDEMKKLESIFDKANLYEM